MRRFPRPLDIFAVALGLSIWCVAAAWPLVRLVSGGLRPHGDLSEDYAFYYGLLAYGLAEGGRFAGMTLCIIGMSCAIGTGLGLRVRPAGRWKADWAFRKAPAICFGVQMLGNYLVQTWYALQGIHFASTSFITDAIPQFWWLLGSWLLTAPAIFTGRGLYLVRWKDLTRRTA